MAEYKIKNGDVSGFEVAFQNAMPGDRIVYHTGRNLAGDCGLYAHYLHSKGVVTLVQRRHRQQQSVFEYIAVRTKKHRAENLTFTSRYKRPKSD